MKMWSARFSKELDEGINDFNSSVSIDKVMFREDIAGSLAHAAMLFKCGIISEQDESDIRRGLNEILTDLEEGRLEINPKSEDIHMFVEQELTCRIGNAGKKLHTARSRNDQVALDIRLYLRTRIDEISNLLYRLLDALLDLAQANLNTVMPGYTHLQIAQPVTFAHHIMAYAQMFVRDYGRLNDCKNRMNRSPLGSCALATTTYPIDRKLTASLLGFDGITENSMDGVSDRDFCVELNSSLSLMMIHLSRLAEEIILWSSNEFRFIELDDAFATGSSIMPQKKNPDIAELVRGKTGRVFGNQMNLMTMLKGLPLCYNKDMQEDKQAIFDSVLTVRLCLQSMTPMLSTMKVDKDRMRNAANKGFINATDCADYLVRKGMPFRDAYAVTGELVRSCIEKNHTLDSLPLNEYKTIHTAFEKDIYESIDLNACVEKRNVEGGPAPVAVRNQMNRLKDELQELLNPDGKGE